MPFYDVICAEGHEMSDVWAKTDEHPPCLTCGAETRRLWAFRQGRGADITWPGGKTFENLAHEPQTFYAPSELKAYLEKTGQQEFVRHMPVPGTDKSPHTSNWATIAPETLASAKALLERVGSAKGTDAEPTDWVQSMTVTVTDEAGVVWAPKGTFGVIHAR